MVGAKLSMRTKVGFGIGATAEGAILFAFNTWNFLFYNQVLGLSGTLAGLAVTISLVLDGIAEPLVGSLSDRWRSKYGRRHPFMFAAPIPLAVSFYFLFSPPAGLSTLGLFTWFTVFATLHRQALTLYQIPHFALGAELTEDYHQRSIVMSYSTVIGVLSASAAFVWGWTSIKNAGGPTMRDAYQGMAMGVAVVSAIAITISAWSTRDRIPFLPKAQESAERFNLKLMLRQIGECVQNRNYRMLLLGLLFLSATIGVRETVHSYVSLFFWELSPEQIRSFGLVTPPAFILAFFLTVQLHKRFDKRRTIVGSLAVVVFSSVVPVTGRLLGLMPNGNALVPILMVFYFLFYGAWAIQMISVLSALADVADEHELLTGKRQEGVFFAARTFFGKLSTGFGHIIAGSAIDLIKFPTGAKVGEVDPTIVTQLGVLDGLIAVVPTLIGMYYYGRYSIDRVSHMGIQARLAERRSQAPKPAHPLAQDAAVAAGEPAAI
jgi:glycoside/pentoside/hexuronide:cation symporter, GPH family